jgi:hypothetical protein
MNIKFKKKFQKLNDRDEIKNKIQLKITNVNKRN